MRGAMQLMGLSFLLLGFAGAHAAPINGCDAKGELKPICGLHGSEDIEVLPNSRQLLVSQSRVGVDENGRMLWQPSELALVSLDTRSSRALYPSAQGNGGGRTDWGDATCPGEIGAKLSPHGMHLSRRSDGHWQLLVVNHGSRESVELFEVITRAGAANAQVVSLEWRGCAVAPPNSSLNDTASLPDNGFLVTVMMDARESMEIQRQRALRGENTGHVLRWHAKHGFEQVPGSAMPMPNGIQSNPDGTLMFVAVNGTGEVRKYDLARVKLLATARVPNPDNLSWSPDGLLLVAGLQPEAKLGECMANFSLPCGAAFNVFAINPATMNARRWLAHEGAPMGLATVAVQAGDHLYIGSAAGDRILQAPLPPAAAR